VAIPVNNKTTNAVVGKYHFAIFSLLSIVAASVARLSGIVRSTV